MRKPPAKRQGLKKHTKKRVGNRKVVLFGWNQGYFVATRIYPPPRKVVLVPFFPLF